MHHGFVDSKAAGSYEKWESLSQNIGQLTHKLWMKQRKGFAAITFASAAAPLMQNPDRLVEAVLWPPIPAVGIECIGFLAMNALIV